ncbi:jerky protein homolog-like, partial [Mercenaria mercenaria]|uniref:jerky protein homolog-like n=1 Tax=Mercenaria mercenaria TaxID=6596 RepID=UPI00234F43C9
MSSLLRIKLQPTSKKAVLRQYSPTSMTNAYNLVKDRGVSVYMAAKLHGVPTSTLRDRVDNRVSIETVKSGPEPVLTLEEEAKLCAHLKELAEVGYGYTRAETIALASDYTVALGKRNVDNPFSMKWFYGFMKRWPELNVVRPSSLSEQRAKCDSDTCIYNYFCELNRIVSKYALSDKPQNIYNIDEKGINTEFKPPNVVAGKASKQQTIMAERSKTVTVIGGGNALGQSIPPFFVFPGERLVDGLMDGKTPGADGVMTKTGWSNTDVFRKYLKDHFVKFVQGRDMSDTSLVLYDGHRSHLSVDLIEWAQDNNIVLFVLPPHTSHVLQPMDIGCFGPLQLKYSQECTTFARLNHRVVTRYDVCGLACKAYAAALNTINLQSAFKKAGIFPLLDGKTMCESLGTKTKPSMLYSCTKNDKDIALPNNEHNETSVNDTNGGKDEALQVPEQFFSKRKGVVVQKVTNKRRNVNNIVGGKALEGDTVEKLRKYHQESEKQKPHECKSVKSKQSVKQKKVSKKLSKPFTDFSQTACKPLPGPSHINLACDSSSVASNCQTDSSDESE